MVSNNLSQQDVIDQASKLDFPSSVVEFFQGYLGQPYGGFPEPLRSNIIRDKPRIDARPGLGMKPLDFKKIRTELKEKYGSHITEYDVASYCMYPKVFEEFQGFVEKYGDLRCAAYLGRDISLYDGSVVPTRYFLSKPTIGEEMTISIEKGKTLTIKLLAVGPLNVDKGTRECFFELNGEVSCSEIRFLPGAEEGSLERWSSPTRMRPSSR
jgi:pyruvate carboxylase